MAKSKNELQTTTAHVPVDSDDYDPYAEVAGETSRGDIVGDLLKYTKHGQWKYGQEQNLMDVGTKLVFFMPGMKRGWVRWHEGAVTDRKMGLVIDGFKMPLREELGDEDENEWGTLNDRPIDPWQKTYNIPACNGAGELFTFVSSSKGGLSAIGEVTDKYSKRRRMKPDEIPVIELGSRSYDHRDYGETFAPVLKVVGWIKIPETFNDLNAALGSDGSEIDDTLFTLEDLTDEPAAKPRGQKQQPRLATSNGRKAPTAPAKKPAAHTRTTAASAKAPAKKGGSNRSVKF